MSKFSVWTFGCRCNQADSAAIREGLCRQSLLESRSHLDADLIVVNTCTVTRRTDQQVRQTVRRLHRENPEACLVVTGCFAERDPETLAGIAGVNLILGNADKERLPEIIEGCGRGSASKIIRAPFHHRKDCRLSSMSHTGGHTRPLIKLQDGCDTRCSYCIVPQVRGPGRSVPPWDVLSEIRALIAQGFKEIVLTGVNLGAYGFKLGNHTRLLDLLQEVVKISGLGRFRLSSIEPMHFERGIIGLAAQNSVFAPHFHIPIQSGSDLILRQMRRPYKAALIQDLFYSIQEKLPNVGLGSDILVGFPGETDKDFDDTCELVRKIPLTYLHVFPFSAREGTDAYTMPGRVPSKVIKVRANLMQQISQDKNFAFRRRFVGKVLPAITLAKQDKKGMSVVLTDNYIEALIPANSVPPNRLVNVRIDDVQPSLTYADIILN